MAPPSGTRVLAFANYDIKAVKTAWERENRQAPSQHMWGCAQLEDLGFAVEILDHQPPPESGLKAKLARVFGNLGLQAAAWRRRGSYDVLYCAHHPTIHLLALLRWVGLFRRPILAVTYQAPRLTGWKARAYVTLFVKGCDRLVCLSDPARDWYAAHGMGEAALDTVPWGFDPPFYHPEVPPAREVTDFLATGVSYRDYRTLLAGFPTETASLTICAAGKDIGVAVPEEKSDRINLVSERLDWRAFGRRVVETDAVIVPLDMTSGRNHNAIGLTAVLEALSCGVPVVVTRNDYLGVDIEAEGVGVWVAPGDPDDMRRVVGALSQDRDRLTAMRARARQLVEDRLNIDTFAQGIATGLRTILNR